MSPAADVAAEVVEVGFRLNGHEVTARVAPWLRLVDLLRDTLGQTGTKEGCGEGECGACTVLVDGAAINSCLMPAPEVRGRAVTTIEGLSRPGGGLSVVQQAFLDEGGSQCGFCSPGIVMASVALLAENPAPAEADVRHALTGNLCRCTGYVQIVESVLAAAARARSGGPSPDGHEGGEGGGA